MKSLIRSATALAAAAVLATLGGCGTAVNATVAGYETNIAQNQQVAGQIALRAKIWSLCMTPFSDMVNASAEQRAAIVAGCVPSTSASESVKAITDMAPAQAAMQAQAPLAAPAPAK